MASAAFGSADKLIVGVVLGPVAAGVYGIGTGVCDRLTQLTAPFSRVLVPFASSRLAAGKSESAAPLFELACRWVACLLASAGVVILLWGNYLLAHWISPSFAVDAGGMLRVLVIVYAGFSTAAPGYQMALGLGEVQLLAGLGVAGSLVSLVAIGLGGAKYGLLGAAVGNVPYLLVLGAPARVARLLGLPAWRVVLVDIGLPLLVLVPALVMSSSDAEIRAWASVSLLLLCGFFARERGRRASLGAILAE
jgi:O-antigen/teichoic acid export membrane protein